MTKKHELKQKAKSMKPHIHIGRKGFTKEAIKEITMQLNDKRIIKIKFLKSAVKDRKHKKAMAIELAGKTNSMLIDRIGSVIVLHKPKKNGDKKINKTPIKKESIKKEIINRIKK